MHKLAREVLKKFESNKLLSYGEIQKLYRDRNVKKLNFSCKGTSFFLNEVHLRNGSLISFH